MKVRSLNEFQDAVDKETGWRKRELTTVLFDAQGARDSRRSTALRAGIALLYAHWEGWIKGVAESYIEHVAAQRLRYDELSNSFLALALQGKINEFSQTRQPESYSQFINFLRSDLQERARFGSSRSVVTEANLSSSVLHKIIAGVGLEYGPYELLGTLIDHSLLRRRNKIAHGEYLDLDLTEFELIYEEITEALRAFTTDVLNSAATRAYRK